MKKLLISLLFASTVIACSTNNSQLQPAQIVLDNCSDARDLVKSNHEKIKLAFADNDAYNIGALELENRSIVHSNLDCFPKFEKHMKEWKKMDKNM